MREPANLPALLQSFFTTRLMTQRKVSPHTIASYRDTFRLLLQFAQKRLHKAPSQLGLDDLDASLVGAFLDDLENSRHNGTRSRNLRLTAIRSFFRYASLEAPAHSGIIQRVLAIPNQRQRRYLLQTVTGNSESDSERSASFCRRSSSVIFSWSAGIRAFFAISDPLPQTL